MSGGRLLLAESPYMDLLLLHKHNMMLMIAHEHVVMFNNTCTGLLIAIDNVTTSVK